MQRIEYHNVNQDGKPFMKIIRAQRNFDNNFLKVSSTNNFNNIICDGFPKVEKQILTDFEMSIVDSDISFY